MKILIDAIQMLVDLIRLQANDNPEVPTSEGVADAYQWYLDTLKDDKNTRVTQYNESKFRPGKIYIFKYQPKYKDVLEYYDQNPVLLSLGRTVVGGSELEIGLNISWYPPKARKYIIEKIQKMYKSQMDNAKKKSPYNAKEQASIPMDLYALKMALDKVGLSFAIRTYIPDNIKNPKSVVCYEDWEIVSRMDKPKIIPELKGIVSLFDIYKRFELYIRYQGQNQAAIKRRTDEAKKQQKYRFKT